MRIIIIILIIIIIIFALFQTFLSVKYKKIILLILIKVSSKCVNEIYNNMT